QAWVGHGASLPTRDSVRGEPASNSRYEPVRALAVDRMACAFDDGDLGQGNPCGEGADTIGRVARVAVANDQQRRTPDLVCRTKADVAARLQELAHCGRPAPKRFA